MRSLADVVSASDFAGTNQSEYLETILVAVPKCALLPLLYTQALAHYGFCAQKPHQGVGELVRAVDADGRASVSNVRPTSLVSDSRHRGAVRADSLAISLRMHSKIAQDDEFALFSVTLFRRVKDEFAQKAREKKCVATSASAVCSKRVADQLLAYDPAHRFIVRDFTYDEEAIEKQRRELENLLAEEKELWVRLEALDRLLRRVQRRLALRWSTDTYTSLLHRPTCSACPASTSPTSSKPSSTSRSSAHTSRAYCGTACQPRTSARSSQCVPLLLLSLVVDRESN